MFLVRVSPFESTDPGSKSYGYKVLASKESSGNILSGQCLVQNLISRDSVFRIVYTKSTSDFWNAAQDSFVPLDGRGDAASKSALGS